MVIGFDYTIDRDSGVAKTSMDTLPLGLRSITLETQAEKPVRENLHWPLCMCSPLGGPCMAAYFQNTEH